MNKVEAIREIADILEIDDADVDENQNLKDFDTWDSIAILSIISLVSENTGKFLHATEISSMVTVSDLIKLLVTDK